MEDDTLPRDEADLARDDPDQQDRVGRRSDRAQTKPKLHQVRGLYDQSLFQYGFPTTIVCWPSEWYDWKCLVQFSVTDFI